MPGSRQQEQVRCGEKLVKLFRYAPVQVWIILAKNDANRPLELLELRYEFRSGPHSPQQILIQTEKCRACARRIIELLIQKGNELISYFHIAEKPANLPPIHAPKNEVIEHH